MISLLIFTFFLLKSLPRPSIMETNNIIPCPQVNTDGTDVSSDETILENKRMTLPLDTRMSQTILDLSCPQVNIDGAEVSSDKRMASLIPNTHCSKEKTGTGTVDASVDDRSTVRNSAVPTTKENIEGTKMCVDVFVSDNTKGTGASSDERMASLMSHDPRLEEKAEGAKISVPVSEKSLLGTLMFSQLPKRIIKYLHKNPKPKLL